MNVFGTRFENVTETHLEALIDGKVGESRTIEYKIPLPGETRDDKLEFLRDVSSFANAAGGYVVYGMRADEGVPTLLAGFPSDTFDSAILRLDQSLLKSPPDQAMKRAGG